MSSFFTLPASQKKRKRAQKPDQENGIAGSKSKRRETRDESISGSDSEEEDNVPDREDFSHSDDESEEEEFANEDPAAKRVRLAEQYLANTQKEVLLEEGFDAADVDQENLRRRMGERLKEDTAETRGRLYKWIADDMAWNRADQRMVRMDGKSITAVAIQGQFVYTAGKDLSLSKWELPSSETPETEEETTKVRASKKPKRRAYTRGSQSRKNDRDYDQHTAAILCLAASQDGKFVVTGGADNKLIAWDAVTLKPLKVFTQHRDSVTGLAFRRGTNQLYSASKDRTVKVWSLDELAYVETLFGHQDEVVDVGALAQEKCITVGARDRTARLWKVVEESQLVFRGGGAPSKPKPNHNASDDKPDVPIDPAMYKYNEGSTDRITCIDDDTFLTASDNGSISLWSVHKKKPVYTLPLAHGLEPAPPLTTLSAEKEPNPADVFQSPAPRWITALRAIPYSNVFVSGSWDGYVRVWRVTSDKRRIEALGPLECVDDEGLTTSRRVEGVINDLAIDERGDRGKEGIVVIAGVGKEPRLGRWRDIAGAKNGMAVFSVPRSVLVEDDAVDGPAAGAEKNDDAFEGFDD
ncbi:WD40 repeat-like protein [Acrodontium crateriforme]|uniref:WD40 repeat-like protein n=1 Tax=Acrodontium crateriforme TaxID=150365 RepID=A0AAQ3R9Y8_9PEZI|nr:WD40 repeat-like protein [Acrodontium crateriforme]